MELSLWSPSASPGTSAYSSTNSTCWSIWFHLENNVSEFCYFFVWFFTLGFFLGAIWIVGNRRRRFFEIWYSTLLGCRVYEMVILLSYIGAIFTIWIWILKLLWLNGRLYRYKTNSCYVTRLRTLELLFSIHVWSLVFFATRYQLFVLIF